MCEKMMIYILLFASSPPPLHPGPPMQLEREGHSKIEV
jgi:hypothetical protein